MPRGSCAGKVRTWKHPAILTSLLLGLAVTVPANAQIFEQAPKRTENTAAPQERVIGEVTATDPSAKQITIKADAGSQVAVIFQERTLYLRVPPGETDLKKAVRIAPAEIGVGDRVLARGWLSEDKKSLPAVAVIVVNKAELTQKQEREREAWQKRSIAGAISALNRETQQITLSVRSPEGTKAVVIESAEKAIFRRYAPDSVRFRDARPSSFADLKVGDSLRVLGEKNADGSRIKPEQIVSAPARTIAGIVNSIDVNAREIKITILQSNKALIIRIDSDSMLRRIPPAKGAQGSRAQAGGSGTGAASHAGSEGRPSEGERSSTPAHQSPQANASASESGPRASKGSTIAGIEPDRMPALTFAELKQGEIILVSFTEGAEPSRVNAIVLLAGAEPLLNPAPGSPSQIGGVWNFFDISLP